MQFETLFQFRNRVDGPYPLFLIPFLLFAAQPLLAQDNSITRIRLTETSVTEVGRVSGLHSVKIKTRGYGLTYVHQSGAGLSYTFLTSRGNGKVEGTSNEIDLKHNYFDLTYTYGDRFIVTTGVGLGVSGGGSYSSNNGNHETARWSESKSVTLGPGVSIGWFEVYWIHRRNWAVYHFGAEKRVLPSQHYMLGLGARL